MNITTSYYKCPIGKVEIKALEDVIISISIIDDVNVDGILIGSDSFIIKQAVAQLDEYFIGKRKAFDLPLDMTIGTDFQRLVWNEVNQIPFGQTRSYMDIAKKLGSEKKTRAVGLANGQNPWWIVIPCHRVVGADGNLTGYAGGMWRKKWLLDFESKNKQLSISF
jgi:methylated-DNA-[protein]-cysteine S-methyltransferase